MFTKKAYHHGVVIVRCESCDSLHLMADNLGWFEDGGVNIEELMRRKGQEVRKIKADGLFQFAAEELNKLEQKEEENKNNENNNAI